MTAMDGTDGSAGAVQIPPASGDDDQRSQCGRDRWTGALDIAGKRATPARSGPVEPHRVGSHGTVDVLHLLLADEVERQSELALQLVEGCAGNRISPGLHICSSRAATLTPSPSRSSPSTTTSPRLIPIR